MGSVRYACNLYELLVRYRNAFPFQLLLCRVASDGGSLTRLTAAISLRSIGETNLLVNT
jgi:hypothetical protein